MRKSLRKLSPYKKGEPTAAEQSSSTSLLSAGQGTLSPATSGSDPVASAYISRPTAGPTTDGRSKHLTGTEEQSEIIRVASLPVSEVNRQHRALAMRGGALENTASVVIPEAATTDVDDIGEENSYGMRVLYNPPFAVLDIVLVHGLTGSAYTTWLHEESDVHWPRDLLKNDMADARIMTFGYDADVVNFWTHAAQDGISGYANDLLGSLAGCRGDVIDNRKIVFVAHSLGGLVTQRALCISRESRFAHLRIIETCTIGLCFVGTPHHGADLTDWGTIRTNMFNIVRPANRNIIKLLKRGSEVLGDVQDAFQNVLEKRKEEASKIEIVCFYELLPLIRSHIVPKDSAVIAGELNYPIRANHMTRDTKIFFAKSEECQGYLRQGALAQTQELKGATLKQLPAATETFYGRATELLAIEEVLDPTKPGQRGIVLCGIGGSGKTQLALRYVEQCRQSYIAVMWIDASSAEHTKQSFAEAADIASSNWPSRDLPLAYVGSNDWHKVITRLRCTRHTHWLLIIDSVDDLDQDNFRQYIPSCDHGSVLVTSTQNQAPAIFRLTKLEVDRLDIESSRELLLSRASNSIEDVSLSEEEQAGVLLAKDIVSFSNSITEYRTHYRLLMEKYPPRSFLFYDKEHSIITVFSILYNFVQQKSPEAAALVIFIAILGPWQIPISLMKQFQLNEIEGYDSTDGAMTTALERVLSSHTVLRLALDYLVDSNLPVGRGNNGLNEARLDIRAAHGLAMNIAFPSESFPSGSEIEHQHIVRAYLAPLDRCIALIQKHIPADDLTLPNGRFCSVYAKVAAQLAQAYLCESRPEDAKRHFHTAIEFETIKQGVEWPST
ncbi:MAG: hypothetical protein M1816_000930 [Peltula sp. TS41687]|nr:MAG: hypothetical protein M1816_000930 [Peltula sp. TS41687]